MRHLARLLPLAAVVLAVALRPLPALADAQVVATPGTVMPGETTKVSAACGSNATSASLSGTSFGGLSEIAMARNTAAGPGAFMATVSVPRSTQPGTYDLQVTCNTGESGVGTLVVASEGGPATGDGSTSTGANQTLLLGGLTLLVIAGAGVLLLRRRPAQR